MEKITGGVTAAKGFCAAAAEAGIKYKNRKDMAMIYSKTPCKTAGVFTSNVVKAAPVLWDKKNRGEQGRYTCGCYKLGHCERMYREAGIRILSGDGSGSGGCSGDNAGKCADLFYRGDRDAASGRKADRRRAHARKGTFRIGGSGNRGG